MKLVMKVFKHHFLLAIFVFLLIICGFALWYKIFLPEVYYFTAIMLSILIVVQLPRKKRKNLLILQIALLGLFLRNVYSLHTNYGVIPLDDGNWGYAVVKTFKEAAQIFVIRSSEPPVRLMEWYSQWPLLHTFTAILSEIAGIDPFFLAFLLPSIISLLSFSFVYFLVEDIRKVMGLSHMITPLALLTYVITAESLFWPSQFVHQNLGILFVAIILRYIFLLQNFNRKYVTLILFFLFSVIISHSYTSFVIVGFLVFLFFSSLILTKIRRSNAGHKLFEKYLSTQILSIALVSFCFLIIWYENYGVAVWSNISYGLNRLINLLLGIKELEYLPPSVTYPDAITPSWALTLVTYRDIAIYIPAIFGFLVILFKKCNIAQRFTLISSVSALGSMFLVDNFVFRVAVFRLVVIFMPLICILSASSYSQLFNKLKYRSQVIASICMIVLVTSSFIGLWGHQFAPIYLFDPSVDPVNVGERYYDSIRVNNFFSRSLPIDNYQAILTDDPNPLAYLLSSKDYYKIKWIGTKERILIGPENKVIVCSFKDLFMYSCFAKRYSPLNTTQEANDLRSKLNQQLGGLNQIFDDGKYRVWVHE